MTEDTIPGLNAEETVELRNRLGIARLAAGLSTWDKNPKNEAVLTKLEEPISMSFANETPLEDVLKYIKQATVKPGQAPIPIYVDPVGLQQAERSLNSTVQLDLEGVPLKTSLRLILKQLGLAYCIRDGVLIISSVQGIREELAEAAFELLGSGNEKVDMRMLLQLGIFPEAEAWGAWAAVWVGMAWAGGMGGGMRSMGMGQGGGMMSIEPQR